MQLRTYMPKSLFGRMLAIIMVPMLLVQLVTVFIFYERHWDSVTRHMGGALGGEIALLVARAGAQPTPEEMDALNSYAATYFGFAVQFRPDEILAASDKVALNYAEETLFSELDNRLSFPWAADLRSDNDWISVDVQLANGVMRLYIGRKRLFSSTSWSFLGWTIGSSVLLFCIALIFMQGQVRPIRRLAEAARQLGLGRTEVDYQLEGAKEVRLAGRAFQAMQHRITRHLNERTTMLAGVSHDLRTPLTRMKLQTAMLPDGDEIRALSEDIDEMQHMVEAYLSFARGEAGESAIEIDFSLLLRQAVSRFAHEEPERLVLILPTEPLPPCVMRPMAIRRAIDNLIGNAMRYAKTAEIRVRLLENELVIMLDDDGPGIPENLRLEAILPFKRLEESRNQETGGTGLGLSIANDIILSHGGELKLGEAPQGGLRVWIKLPI